MGTTSNYSWPYPEATGLVKDGWEDIKDLATAIDTTAAANFSGDFKKISSTTVGSGVSSVIISNCFSSSYDNYKIVHNIPSTCTSNGQISLRLRASGTTSTTGWYYLGYNANTSSLNHDTNANQSGIVIAQIASGLTDYNGGEIELISPFLARRTIALTTFIGFDSSLATRRAFSFQGFHDVATSYDSLEFVTSAGTMTGGTIKVYGYKN